MRKLFSILALAALTDLFPISAHAGEDQFFGTLFGMTAGGLIGNQFGHGAGKDAATIGGVAAGGFIGNEAGRAADNAHYASQSYYVPSYAYQEPVYFYNPSNKYEPNYVAPPAPPSEEPVTYINKATGYCRQVSQQVDVNGTTKEIYGIACLQRDGSWKVVQ
jgi:surface antigen